MSFNENSKAVVYKEEHFQPTFAKNSNVAGPLEWIARITSHIPKKGAKQVIYYGAIPSSDHRLVRMSVPDGNVAGQTPVTSACNDV